MKWYGIVAILVLIFGLAGIVYLGMNTDKIGFGEPNYISKQIPSKIIIDQQKLEIQPKKYSEDCNYWYGQWQLMKFQRDSYDALSAKYLQFDMEMDEKMEKLNKSCYGR